MPLFTAPLLTGIAGALTIASATPVAAAGPVGVYTTLPVAVAACEQSSLNVNPALEGPAVAFQLDNLRISFVNRAALKATDVRFAVSTASGTQTIEDVGSFAPGARITHNFAPAQTGLNFSDPAKCAVQSVTFSDGSTWQPS
jgi:hypothetical protein